MIVITGFLRSTQNLLCTSVLLETKRSIPSDSFTIAISASRLE